jgi:hypothetical protein
MPQVLKTPEFQRFVKGMSPSHRRTPRSGKSIPKKKEEAL